MRLYNIIFIYFLDLRFTEIGPSVFGDKATGEM